MTGFAKGKILLDAKVLLDQKEIDAFVFIHVKGYALAKVTHLDIESDALDFKERSKGTFCTLTGIKNGIEIEFKNFGIEKIVVTCDLLNRVLGIGEKTRAFVGFKEKGIFIGFKKGYIEKLEKLAREIEPDILKIF